MLTDDTQGNILGTTTGGGRGFWRPTTVMMFMDDAAIEGRRCVVASVVARAAEAYGPAGITLVPAKDIFFVADASSVDDDVLRAENVTDIGFKFLGNFVGTSEYRRELGKQQLAAMKPDYRALMMLPIRLAFQLLYFCYNSRPGYLARVMGELLGDGLRDFDSAISEYLGKVIECPTGGMRLLNIFRKLSPKHGGLGMHAYSGVRTDRAVLLSRAMTVEYVQRHRQFLMPVLGSSAIWPDVRFGFIEAALFDLSEEERQALGSGLESSIRRASATVVDKIEGEVIHRLLGEFDEEGEAGRSKQALLRSRMGNASMAWWRSLVGNQAGEKYFPSADFAAMMRFQLFSPFRNTRGEAVTHCPCCRDDRRQPLAIGHLYSHPMGCSKAANYTWRHDDVRDAVYNTLRRGFMHMGINGYRVQKEEVFARQDMSGLSYRADVFLDVGVVRYIDIAVVDPGCPKYLQLPDGGSASMELVGAHAREVEKITDFRARMSHVLDYDTLFIPFVVETSGRLGPAAAYFLRNIGLREVEVRKLIRFLPVLLARHGGRSLPF